MCPLKMSAKLEVCAECSVPARVVSIRGRLLDTLYRSHLRCFRASLANPEYRAWVAEPASAYLVRNVVHFPDEQNAAHFLAAYFEAGGNVDRHKDIEGASALHGACRLGRASCVRLLCAARACLFTSGEFYGGKTPLQVAAEWNHEDCVHELLDAGARRDELDGHPMMSVALARERCFGTARTLCGVLRYRYRAAGWYRLPLPLVQRIGRLIWQCRRDNHHH